MEYSDNFNMNESSQHSGSRFTSSEEAIPGLILGMHPVNERRRYKVTPSPIGWVQT